MIYIKKNIWLGFYFITFLWVFFLIGSIYSIFNNTYNEISSKQQSVAKMTANSLESSLRRYEVMLDIISYNILEGSSPLSKHKINISLTHLLKLDTSIVSINVLEANGDLYSRASISGEPSGIIDLPVQWNDYDLSEVVKMKGMLINRTVYNKNLNKIIIPLSKVIRDKKGNVLYIFLLAIDIEKGFDFFLKNNLENQLDNTYLYREKDGYFQVAPTKNIKNENIYFYQTPIKVLEEAKKRLEKQTGKKYNELKYSNEVVVHEIIRSDISSLAASYFLEKYDLWIVTETEFDTIYSAIYLKTLRIIVFFIFLLLITWHLFKSINLSDKNKKKMLEYQATHDHFTGLHNRFYLEEKIKSTAQSKQFSILLIVIDKFKTIKDSYGHEIADKVLSSVSSRLKVAIESNDLLVRYSDDEFIIVKFNSTFSHLNKFSDNILQKVSQEYRVKNHYFTPTVSIGISSNSEEMKSLDHVLRSADIAVYESKKHGNRTTFFKDSFKLAHQFREKVEYEFKNAIDKNEFFMVYQPQVDTNKEVKGLEALIRWNSSALGFIPPDKFISIAENCGKMPEIGDFIIDKALSEVSDICLNTGINLDLSINVSVKQFLHADFYDNLLLSIEKYAHKKENLILEITESVFIEDLAQVKLIIMMLKNQGIRISLDDFGTGYSSLNLLKHLPIDELKIDKTFIDDLLTNPTANVMLDNLISLAKKLNIKTVAEGIELKEQFEILQGMKCDTYQGYLFAKPMQLDDLNAFLITHGAYKNI